MPREGVVAAAGKCLSREEGVRGRGVLLGAVSSPKIIKVGGKNPSKIKTGVKAELSSVTEGPQSCSGTPKLNCFGGGVKKPHTHCAGLQSTPGSSSLCASTGGEQGQWGHSPSSKPSLGVMPPAPTGAQDPAGEWFCEERVTHEPGGWLEGCMGGWVVFYLFFLSSHNESGKS